MIDPYEILLLQMRLQRAAKARIDRMCKNHARRRELNAPEWLKQEWNTGRKDQMAQVLQDCNWDKDTVRVTSHLQYAWELLWHSWVTFPDNQFRFNFLEQLLFYNV